MVSRLPTPGSDDGTWGDILNDYLSQSLKADGTIKDNAVITSAIAANAVTNAKLESSVQSSLSLANTALQSIPDATSSVKGAIRLTGDLGGTATSPTVPGLSSLAPLASPTFTGTVTTPAIKVTGGTLAAGKTLVSDAVGNATWTDRPWSAEIYLNSVPVDVSYVGYQDNDGGIIVGAPSGVVCDKVIWRLSAPSAVIGGSGNMQIQWYLGSTTTQETTLIQTTQVAAGQHEVSVTFSSAQTCALDSVLRAKLTTGTTTLPSKSQIQWRGRFL